jgi:hypothetical protein
MESSASPAGSQRPCASQAAASSCDCGYRSHAGFSTSSGSTRAPSSARDTARAVCATRGRARPRGRASVAQPPPSRRAKQGKRARFSRLHSLSSHRRIWVFGTFGLLLEQRSPRQPLSVGPLTTLPHTSRTLARTSHHTSSSPGCSSKAALCLSYSATSAAMYCS